MGTLFALVAGFFAFEALGYAFHRFLHSERSGPLHRSHMKHHGLYPVSDFLSNPYRSAGGDATTWRFVVAALPLAALGLWLAPLWLALPLILELAAVGLVNNYIHDAVHIQGHWLERFALYRRWRAQHMVHHANVKRNYGIVTFTVDRATGTYQAPVQSK